MAKIITYNDNLLTETDIDATSGNLTLSNRKYIETDEVKARDGDGLKLYDDDGNGIFVEDGGNVGIGTTGPSEKLSVDGNISVTGTVDGRDIASDGSKLDGIESGATADQTKADIDALNIDADTVDGSHASAFATGDNFNSSGTYASLRAQATTKDDVGLGNVQNINVQNSFTQNDGQNIATDEVRARDAAGLKLYDDGGNGIFVENGGNVGIGTTNPDKKLHIAGGSYQSDTTFRITTEHTNRAWDFITKGFETYNANNYDLEIITPDDDKDYNLLLTNYGNVGIGTTDPGAKLDVNGNLKVHNVQHDDSFDYDDTMLFAPQAYFEAESPNAPVYWVWNIDDFAKHNNTSVPFSKVARTTSYDQLYSDYIPVNPGDRLYGEIWAYRETGASGSAGTLYYGIERYDKDKKSIANNRGCTYFVASGVTVPKDSTWHKYSGYTSLPASHSPYDGSDGGPVRYVRVRILVGYFAGTIQTDWGGILLRRVEQQRDSGEIAFNGNVGIGTTSPSEKLSVNGNISVTGTVDGRDVSVDGTKLDGIESGATADQTKADIDALNIDADTVDGSHASAFASSSHSHALGDLSNVTATGEGSGGGFDADTLDGHEASYFATSEGGGGNLQLATVTKSYTDFNSSNPQTILSLAAKGVINDVYVEVTTAFDSQAKFVGVGYSGDAAAFITSDSVISTGLKTGNKGTDFNANADRMCSVSSATDIQADLHLVIDGDIFSSGTGFDACYRHSGFSSTVIDSYSAPTLYSEGIAWDSTNILSVGQYPSLHYKHSGFSSTIIDTYSSPSAETLGIAWDSANVLSVGMTDLAHFKQSGFSSTVTDSYSSPATYFPAGIAWDSTNVLSVDADLDAHYKHSGFSSTVTDSYSTPAPNGDYYNNPRGIDWVTSNVLSVNTNYDLHFKHSGFSSTVIDSHSAPDTYPFGIAGVTVLGGSLTKGEIKFYISYFEHT